MIFIIQFITIDGAKETAGHYCPATKAGNIICISGQLPINPYTGEKCTGGITEQTQQVLKNLDAILHAAKTDKTNVMKTTVYISDISLWDEVNTVYAQYFGSHRPARAIVPTKELHHGFFIELEAMAFTAES